MNKLVQRAAIAVGLVLASMTMTACSSSSGSTAVQVPVDAAVETGPTTDANCDPALTYDSFGRDFFGTFCARCHFWTQESAQLDGASLAAAAGTSTSMPPSAPFPTSDQRMQLVQWLSCGAP